MTRNKITEYYSAIKKKEKMTLAATWIDLESVKLSRSQRKTNIWYCLYVESKKNGTSEFTYKTQIEYRCKKQFYGYQKG